VASENLVFERAQSGSTALVFGDGLGPISVNVNIIGVLPALTATLVVAPNVEVELFGVLPPLEFAAEVVSVVAAQMVVMLPALTAALSVQYLSNTARPTVGIAQGPWQSASHASQNTEHAQQDSGRRPVGWAAFWQMTVGAASGVENLLPDGFNRTIRPDLISPAQDATGLHTGPWFTQQDGTRAHQNRDGVFQEDTISRRDTYFKHQDGTRTHGRLATSHQKAAPLQSVLAASHQLARAFSKDWWSRFKDAVPPPAGLSVLPVTPPPVLEPCYFPNGILVFEALLPAGANLVFICDGYVPPPPPSGGQIIVPVRRVYFVINNVTLYRVSDGAPVPVFSLSLSLDASSWAWGFDAVLPAKAQALVAPGSASGPVERVASVNGTAFRVLAEGISRERSFGDASIRISGRGFNAILAAPYAPVMTFSNTEGRTARQLMDDVLTVNGIPLGWAVDWGLIDWNVPAGAFAQQGSWIDALTSIAGAAGGYLIPHPSAQSIRVRHRYPVAPWEWSTVTPDFVLPVDAVARESLRWLEKPAYNRVFVSGQDVGVLGQVTRAGTAGDVLAPMVVDSLITEAAAARQRGLRVLADTGHQLEVSLRLPVLAETGIIEPGAFVEYQDGSQGQMVRRLGIVRATQVEAGMPEVWQTLGVQAYA
jgi:hypothetical protein